MTSYFDILLKYRLPHKNVCTGFNVIIVML